MKLVGKIGVSYFVLLTLFFLLIVVSQTIPSYRLYDNVKKSAETIQSEGLRPKIGNLFIYRLDNFTDVLMLNIAVSTEADSPVQSAMLNRCYRLDNLKELDYATEMITVGMKDSLIQESYSRYWHGNQVILRPLLLFFDYHKIRILNYFCLGLLLCVLIILMLRKCSIIVPVAFIISLLLVGFPIVPLSMQFSSVFYITFVSLIIMLLNEKRILDLNCFICFFFIVGGITCYLDLLTIPLITLGLPLLVYLFCINKKNRYRNIFLGSISWVIGYAGIWFSKFLLGTLLTGKNIINEGISQAIIRSSTHSNARKDFDMSIKGICSYVWSYIQNKDLEWLILLVVLLIILFIIAYSRLSKNRFILKENFYLLIIACMPFIWYFFIRNHSIIHSWFTWRSLIIFFFAIILYLYVTIDFKKVKYKLLKRKGGSLSS